MQRSGSGWFLVLALMAGLLLMAMPALGQPSKASQKATQLGQDGQWEEAIVVLEKAVAGKEIDDASAWFQLARAYEQNERWEDVIAAASKALELNFPRPGLAHLLLARGHQALGQRGEALDQLEQSALGGSNRFLLKAIEGDPRFEPLKSDPRFLTTVERLTPCTAPEYRQFDFWLGDFEVQDPKGAVVGENTISLHLAGCLLMESWRGGSGMHGMSMNFYDPTDGTWNQIFVDNNGNPSIWPALKGGLDAEGAMVLWSPEGESRSKWTWTAVSPGKVRQMAEQTTDGGKTWQVTWDSYYVSKP
ncbi:MAG: tetratricopeptide repeat protein [Thermoanaerobaculia bacterium]|nr:tetratricopeptide repeat protein [Thermoanaerobaculia bacterium]